MLQEQERQRRIHLRKINQNIARVALQPARRRDPTNPINHNPFNEQQQQQQQEQQPPQQQAGPPANLSPTPRNLHMLWQEWEHGIGGNKAAKLFTPEERGRVKHKYCRRRVIWKCIERQIARSVSYNVAIDRIYQVYGESATVTSIINKTKKDNKDGNLHVCLR